MRWLDETYAAAALNHAVVAFADPVTLEAWADVRVEGSPIWSSRFGSSTSRSSRRSSELGQLAVGAPA